MINAEKMCELFQYMLKQKWGYIYGASGQRWTQAKQDAATRDTTIKYGSRWIGQIVTDCSGAFVWAYKQCGEAIYHGSNTIWNKYCSAKGKLPKSDIKPGTAVFLVNSAGNRHHIGLYVGNDTVIEAKSTYYGVVTSKLSHWNEWGELAMVDYTNTSPSTGNPTVRKGMTGEAVEYAQTLLNYHGFAVKVDGVFGEDTETAVKRFQQTHDLEVDGIVGKKTWAKLESKPDEDYVQISKKDWLALKAIVDKYGMS